LAAEDRREIQRELETHPPLRDLVRRIQTLVAQPRMASPAVETAGILQANQIAEYLDGTLDLATTRRLEQACLKHDAALSELTALHQILTDWIDQPAEIGHGLRERLYDIVDRPRGDADETPAATALAPPASPTDPRAAARDAIQSAANLLHLRQVPSGRDDTAAERLVSTDPVEEPADFGRSGNPQTSWVAPSEPPTIEQPVGQVVEKEAEASQRGGWMLAVLVLLGIGFLWWNQSQPLSHPLPVEKIAAENDDFNLVAANDVEAAGRPAAFQLPPLPVPPSDNGGPSRGGMTSILPVSAPMSNQSGGRGVGLASDLAQPSVPALPSALPALPSALPALPSALPALPAAGSSLPASESAGTSLAPDTALSSFDPPTADVTGGRDVQPAAGQWPSHPADGIVRDVPLPPLPPVGTPLSEPSASSLGMVADPDRPNTASAIPDELIPPLAVDPTENPRSPVEPLAATSAPSGNLTTGVSTLAAPGATALASPGGLPIASPRISPGDGAIATSALPTVPAILALPPVEDDWEAPDAVLPRGQTLADLPPIAPTSALPPPATLASPVSSGLTAAADPPSPLKPRAVDPVSADPVSADPEAADPAAAGAPPLENAQRAAESPTVDPPSLDRSSSTLPAVDRSGPAVEDPTNRRPVAEGPAAIPAPARHLEWGQQVGTVVIEESKSGAAVDDWILVLPGGRSKFMVRSPQGRTWNFTFSGVSRYQIQENQGQPMVSAQRCFLVVQTDSVNESLEIVTPKGKLWVTALVPDSKIVIEIRPFLPHGATAATTTPRYYLGCLGIEGRVMVEHQRREEILFPNKWLIVKPEGDAEGFQEDIPSTIRKAIVDLETPSIPVEVQRLSDLVQSPAGVEDLRRMAMGSPVSANDGSADQRSLAALWSYGLGHFQPGFAILNDPAMRDYWDLHLQAIMACLQSDPLAVGQLSTASQSAGWTTSVESRFVGIDPQTVKRSQVAELIGDLDQPQLARRVLALNTLKMLTNQTFDYDPTSSAELNRRALQRWQQWLEDSANARLSVHPGGSLVPSVRR
jgi:hypothetical protein